MKRKIISIDQEKCVGCSLCVNACQEGAIGLVDGKAQLLREDYCDGLGNCLPVCPTNAISFIEKEVDMSNKTKEKKEEKAMPCGCPSTHAKTLDKKASCSCQNEAVPSHLSQWPVQIKLVNPSGSYFEGASLLIGATCSAFAYGNFHNDFIKNRITVVGCPKLDNEDYSEKLSEIFKLNDIKDITIARMEVPCCSGLESMVKSAIIKSGKEIPLKTVVISVNGDIIS